MIPRKYPSTDLSEVDQIGNKKSASVYSPSSRLQPSELQSARSGQSTFPGLQCLHECMSDGVLIQFEVSGEYWEGFRRSTCLLQLFYRKNDYNNGSVAGFYCVGT